MNRSTRQVSRVYQLSNYEGDEVDHEDGDGDGAGLDGDVDGDSGGGMEEPSGGDSTGISPLRSSSVVAFYLLFRGFVFLCRLLAKLIGGLFL